MPTVVTRTIGVGKDYANFTAAEADVVNIATSAIGGTDLTLYNGAIVFEADAGTYDEQLVANSTLTTDATRNVTYQPAAGSEHGGAADAGVILYRNAAGQDGTRLQDDYTTLRGLNLYQGNATGAAQMHRTPARRRMDTRQRQRGCLGPDRLRVRGSSCPGGRRAAQVRSTASTGNGSVTLPV